MNVRGTRLLKLNKDDSDFQIQLSRWDGQSHFNTSEFRCRCCNTLILHYDLVLALEKLRQYIQKPIVISSGYRCVKHNLAIGGVKNSGHTKGYAADIVKPLDLEMELFRDAIWDSRKETGIVRVGCYNGYQSKHNFCHVGIRRKWVGRNSLLSQRWGNWENKEENG